MMYVTKLDGRYSGHGFFSHRVEFKSWGGYEQRSVKAKQWIRARNWLWSRFGPSAEQWLARAIYFNDQQPLWAWDTEKQAIYLSEQAYTVFMLKKEYWEDESNL